MIGRTVFLSSIIAALFLGGSNIPAQSAQSVAARDTYVECLRKTFLGVTKPLPLSSTEISNIVKTCDNQMKTYKGFLAEGGTKPELQTRIVRNVALRTIMYLLGAYPGLETTVGNPTAPVTIILYSSFDCEGCTSFNNNLLPKIMSTYISTNRAKLVIRDFPTSTGSFEAAVLSHCVPAKFYLGIYGDLMNTEVGSNFNAVVDEVGGKYGVDRAAYEACTKDQVIIDGLVASQTEFEKLKWARIPAIIINGEEFTGDFYMEDIEELISEVSSAPQPG